MSAFRGFISSAVFDYRALGLSVSEQRISNFSGFISLANDFDYAALGLSVSEQHISNFSGFISTLPVADREQNDK